jgi:translation initiation factor 1
VTVVSGLPAEELPVLAKSLKAKCGSGGKVRGEDLELQGDHTAKLVELLKGLGFKNTKKSGG